MTLKDMRKILLHSKIFLQSRMNLLKSTRLKPGHLAYGCNICGSLCETLASALGRETPSCPTCASTVRMRAIIHLLSMELFGKSLMLRDFPLNKEIKGIGMSDWEVYAAGLKKKLDYSNTFFHKEPRLDITSIDPSQDKTLDFIISTDVLEHVLPPVSEAFVNMRRLLKPGGVLIFSVPYIKEGKTIEHFPNLHKYEILKVKDEYVLKNITKDGKKETFKDLAFHGGPGSTLEVRLFSEPSLIQSLQEAGFKTVRVSREPHYEYGIIWNIERSLPIVARV